MKTTQREHDDIHSRVREHYGTLASGDSGCGCAPTCCGRNRDDSGPGRSPDATSLRLGYSAEQTGAVPAGSNLGLGCGNPQAIAALRPGETVLDLGSGAGFDSFLATRAVGPSGRVIGVDMTPEMVARARKHQSEGGYGNVEFRLGEIERLPVADDSVDVILSNCVINLSPDPQQVFREAFRVLKPGGRLAISDVVALAELPGDLRRNWELHTGCVAGASRVDALQAWLHEAGFVEIRIEPREGSREVIADWFPGLGIQDFVTAATLEAVKPPVLK